MKKPIFFLFHIGYWLAVVMFSLLLMGMISEIDENKRPFIFYTHHVFGCLTIPAFLSFYGSYFWLFPNYLQQHKVRQFIGFGVLMLFLVGMLGANYLVFNLGAEAVIIGDFYNVLLGAILIGGISSINAIVGLVLKGFVTWFSEVELKEELAEKNHAMEMALVKSQLDPHFLFNTINNIDVLILKNPDEASEYLNRLSDIMRFMLFETKTEAIPLQKELAYIEKYIALQKIRTANENYVHYEVQGDNEQREIAPMIFIPFIENAFKHTDNKKIKNAISIKLNILPTSIAFSCVNKYNAERMNAENSNGLGNELIKKRLHLLYPETHELIVKNEENVYSVLLTIQT
ncbi:MAG: sensor histidine kinase [Saprospiraceae bacterium]